MKCLRGVPRILPVAGGSRTTIVGASQCVKSCERHLNESVPPDLVWRLLEGKFHHRWSPHSGWGVVNPLGRGAAPTSATTN